MGRRRSFIRKIEAGFESLLNVVQAAGNSIIDLEGNAFTNNGVTTTEDPVSSGNYVMTGFPGAFLDFGNTSKFSLQSQAFSVKVWIKATYTAFQGELVMGKLPLVSSSLTRWEWSLGVKGITAASSPFGFYIHTGASSGSRDEYIACESTWSAFASNTWRQVIGTYDGSGTKEGMRLYRNGVAIGTQTNLGSSVIAPYDADAKLGVGYCHNRPFKGRIASPQTIDSELTVDQVLALFNEEKSAFGL